MSIASEISRLQQAKADIKTAIEGKGVTVASDATLSDYDDYISAIGGSVDWESIAKGMIDKTTSFSIPASIEIDGSYMLLQGRSNMTGGATIKSGTTTIEQGAFQNCGITSITIPNTVTTIGQQAFEGCKIVNLSIPDSVTTVNAYWARKNTVLESIGFSANQNGLGAGCCSGCTKLTTISQFPTGFTSIATEAFMNTGLVSITIPSTVTSIGSSAFRQCTKLESIVVPDTVTTINAQAFQKCTALGSVTIGSGVTSIGNAAFHESNLITEMIFRGTTPPTLANGNNCLGATTYTFPIYVPDGSVSTYQGATNFTAYASRIKSINDRPTT